MNLKYKIITCVLLAVTLLLSCNKESEEIIVEQQPSVNTDLILKKVMPETKVKAVNGRLVFKSTESFLSTAEWLATDEQAKLEITNWTQTVVNGDIKLQSVPIAEFYSLEDALTASIYTSLTPEQYQEVLAEGLSEPCLEDDIIHDPDYYPILNSEREVQIDNVIVRFEETGVYTYAADGTHANDMFYPMDNIIGGGGGSSGTTNPPITPTYGATLSDGTKIPANNVREIEFGQSDASKFQQWLQGLLGEASVVTMYYDDKHRTKLKFFDEDYLLYHHIGVTIRMQKKKFGIWWRTKADEFRFGWEYAVLKYTFDRPTPLHTPQTLPGQTQPKIPNATEVQFNFDTEKFVLVHIPVLDKEITTSVDQIMRTAFTQSLQAIKNAWIGFGRQYNPQKTGFYGTTKREGIDYSIIATLGQKEQVTYNDGREVLKIHDLRLGGVYKIGVTGNFDDMNGSFADIVSALKYKITAEGDGVSLHKGSFYGAVKYNGIWKFARIVKK